MIKGKYKTTNIGILALSLIFIGFFWFKNLQTLVKIIELKENQISTVGSITDKYRGVQFFEGFVLYYSYTDIDGFKYIDKTRVSPDFWMQKKIGDKVYIIYNKEQNNISRIDAKFDVKDRNYILHAILLSIVMLIIVIYIIKGIKPENKEFTT